MASMLRYSHAISPLTPPIPPPTLRTYERLEIGPTGSPQPSLFRPDFLSEDPVRQNCGRMRQANSDTTARPMRPVPDTKNFCLATTVAAPSYGVETLRLSCCRLSATKTSHISETGPLSGPISPFPQDSRPPPPAIAWAHIHSAPSSNWSPSACQPQRNPLGLLFPTHLGGIWYGCHWSGHR